MTFENFLEYVRELQTRIAEPEDNERLANIIDFVTTLYNERNDLHDDRERLTEYNNRLIKSNNELFRRIGTKENEIDNADEKEPQKMNFSDLFDENGNLK